MQQQTIQQIDDAVSEVFALMLDRSCTPGACLTAASATSTACIQALISFSGSVRGVCKIRLPLRSIALITSELLGAAPEHAEEFHADAAGELCNMIAGSWKSRRPLGGATCFISSPSVAAAECCKTCPPVFGETVIRSYRFEDHCLRLEFGLEYPRPTLAALENRQSLQHHLTTD